jgi:hypothetical protein
MKTRGIVLVVGLALSTIGVILMYATIGSSEFKDTVTLELPEGAGEYAFEMIDMKGGGPISGGFQSQSGSPVWFSLMDEGQFQAFTSGTEHDARFNAIDSAANFSIEQVDMEVCYFVVEHSGDSASTETVQVSYSLPVIDWSMFAVTIGLIVAGAAAFMYAVYEKTKESRGSELQLSKYDDVVFFEEKER